MVDNEDDAGDFETYEGGRKYYEELAPGDLRLMEDELNGRFYLYDNSGPSPEMTNDGPLYIDLNEPVEVHREYCSVWVVEQRIPVLPDGTRARSRVVITHAGLLRLKRLVPALKVQAGQDIGALMQTLALIEPEQRLKVAYDLGVL